MDLLSTAARTRYDSLVRAAPRVVVGLDFDGTLAEIVDDPEAVRLQPGAAAVLGDLVTRVARVAIVTGRPAEQVVRLAGLDALGTELDAAGRELHVFGQYGHERWSSHDRTVLSSPPPPGLSALETELPRLLARCRASDARVEWKGLAVAVHTRQLPDPEAAWDRLKPALAAWADAYGLVLEPGRQVLEIRSGAYHKGDVVRDLADEAHARGVCFCGDDLGDLDAFDAVAALTADTGAGLCVCSGSQEAPRLSERADLVVPGPAGVVDFLRRLAADLPPG